MGVLYTCRQNKCRGKISVYKGYLGINLRNVKPLCILHINEN